MGIGKWGLGMVNYCNMQTPEETLRHSFLSEECSLAEIAIKFPSAIPVLEAYNLNYWCRGKRRLGVACRDQGLSVEQVLSSLRQQISVPQDDARSWKGGDNLTELVRHVLNKFHAPERREFARLENLLRVVLDEYGTKMPSLRSLYEVFLDMKEGNNDHMGHEEALLFPLVEQIQQAVEQKKLPAPFAQGSVVSPVRRIEYEHDLSSVFIKKLRDVTESYNLPENATDNLQALYRGLQDLEVSLHRHIHFENYILHPLAIRTEAKLLSLH